MGYGDVTPYRLGTFQKASNMLRRTVGTALCGMAIATVGLLSAQAADTKKSEIKDGIDGKIVAVDVEKGSVTIADATGREREFSITSETVIVGPRGGLVHKRLKDHRFHKGLPLTVVAHGTTAAELHLGFDRKAHQEKSTVSQPTSNAGSDTPQEKTTPTPVTRTSRFRGVLGSKPAATSEPAKTEEAPDEDSEFPGKVKSVDPVKRMLVITLLNGKDRSFLLPSDIKVTVNGRASKKGLSDKALKEGIPLTVVTETGGHKVKEVKVTAAVTRRVKKAS
jgi:hypothetical protein